ncbi:MAG TPA: glycine cleavage system H protein [bacterium]|nr:glycine cleavage system H protein [bacterium]
MATPSDRLYTKTHEWIQVSGDGAVIGLTEYAVQAIKDIVFLELPAEGKALEQGKPFGVIESVKAVFDLNSPLAGTVSGVNQAVADDFSALSGDPYHKGWLVKVSGVAGDKAQLLDAAAYDKFCAEEHH